MIEIDKGIFKAPLAEVMENISAWEPKFKTVLNLETHTRELILGDGNDLFRKCLYCNVTLFDMAWSGILPPRKEDVSAALWVLKKCTKAACIRMSCGPRTRRVPLSGIPNAGTRLYI